MSLALVLHDLCKLLRDGGQVEPQAWPPLEEQLLERTAALEDRLGDEVAATGLPVLSELLQEATSDFREAIVALKLAFQEDGPELASWIQERVQNADETLRRVRQLLLEYSAMLCEEDQLGDL